MDMENEISYPGKRGKVEIARAYGAMSKAEVFEELIRVVLHQNVKLKEMPKQGADLNYEERSRKRSIMKLVYEDKRGWQFTVRAGLGGDTFSVFYRKPGKSWHSVRAVPWFNTEAEAETALIEYAQKHKMREVKADA